MLDPCLNFAQAANVELVTTPVKYQAINANSS